MAMAGAFSIFAGVYYWFPLMSGRLLHEGLGKAHFWLTFVGAYGTFFPMHLEGLAGRPRHYSELTGPTSSLAAFIPSERGITFTAFFLAGAQILFLVNVVWTVVRGRQAPENPWRATTLEWLKPAAESKVTVVRRPYDYGEKSAEKDFFMQWEGSTEQE